MKSINLFQVFLFVVTMFVSSLTIQARENNNLVYNSEEVNGLVVSKTVYRQSEESLSNYMKYVYKHDDQKRITEQTTLKWDGFSWVKDLRLCYSYNGKQMTTKYYKFKNNHFVLLPEMTITVDQ